MNLFIITQKRWVFVCVAGVLFILTLAGPLNVEAGWSLVTKLDDVFRVSRSCVKLGRLPGAIPTSKVDDLARMCRKPGGLKEVGKMLGKQKYADDVLEDAYFRIAIKNKVLLPDEGTVMFRRLQGTEGLRPTLRKINSLSPPQVKGHLQELRIASHAKERGFDVVALGRRYDDGLKRADTDVDVLLKKGKSIFAIESKAYKGEVPLDMVRADVDSLLVYAKQNKGVIPVFATQNKSTKAMKKIMKRKKCEFISGSPEELAILLDHLLEIR